MKKIVAVCACPAGVAHTFMAAENLEVTAKKKGYEIKVETNGASGIENGLTEDEIKNADYVIIAADTKVEMDRFKGKKLLERSVSDAVRNIKEIFDQIESDNLEIY